jgi:hypothetical protein
VQTYKFNTIARDSESERKAGYWISSTAIPELYDEWPVICYPAAIFAAILSPSISSDTLE